MYQAGRTRYPRRRRSSFDQSQRNNHASMVSGGGAMYAGGGGNGRYAPQMPRNSSRGRGPPFGNKPMSRMNSDRRSPSSTNATKPLTRVMARFKTGGDRDDAYRMEVNEFRAVTDKDDAAMPCVTVRDMKNIVGNGLQRRIWIPLDLCDEVMKHLLEARVDSRTEVKEDPPLDSWSTTPPSSPQMRSSGGHTYDVTQLKERTFKGSETGMKLRFEKMEDDTFRLRNVNDRHDSDSDKPNLIEVIGLRNGLVGRLIKFMNDVLLRYQEISPDWNIPSLYSYSGERRFYFDVRATRWGLRLHVSQVTDLHRNVIGIPLESLVQFRDRLSQAINTLKLDVSNRSKSPTANRRRRARSVSSRRKKNKATGTQAAVVLDTEKHDEEVIVIKEDDIEEVKEVKEKTEPEAEKVLVDSGDCTKIE